ncbi:MAG TPA: Xaa-Pro peptidase family protein [Lentibacillus sp.]|uniref:M24 family metallopeptidase n=1 Tax=Lentibacillus sp. TaxID=1925746 RepID=UPI002B4ABB5C|nr:Xaa-Pro peptidase family protein [Lentibacillus sp.]HLR63363.1 Xaa-Pro peptidase family protein [Lentibacillus sp.]
MTTASDKIKQRLAQLRQRMEAKGIDAVLMTDPDNSSYVSGFRAISYSRPIVYIVQRDTTTYIVPDLEKDHAEQEAAADDFFIYHESAQYAERETSFTALFKGILEGRLKGFVVGLEMDLISASLYQLLKDNGHQIKDIGKDLIAMRAVKDDDELYWIEQAGRLSDIALEASFDHLSSGMSELEFDAYGDHKLLETVSVEFPNINAGFENWTCSGVERSSQPHLYSSTRKFRNNDVVVHSRQVWINQYRAENERTFLLGEPAVQQKQYLQLAIDAQKAAMKMVQPGVKAKDVDMAAFRVFEQAGMSDYVQHRTGHGLGLSEHEEPYLRFDNDLVLQEGMVYTIEPGIYVPNIGGFRHSDTVVVTKDGYRRVTHFPGELEDMMF